MWCGSTTRSQAPISDSRWHNLGKEFPLYPGDDIHETVQLIEQNGGFILDPSAELAPNQWICLFNEPSDVTFAMIQTG
jgi:predicted enzyme related to lactoylglutathione lyase